MRLKKAIYGNSKSDYGKDWWVKTILHLCAKTGSDSQPYADAGYERIIVDESVDVRRFVPPDNVYGIIANPPCTMFSFARTNAKKPRNLKLGMELVEACLRIIWECQYRITKDTQKYSPLKFWVLENPNAMLKWFLGKPAMTYCPSEYGENYQKKTCLWGLFNEPKRLGDKKSLTKFDYMKSKDIHPEHFGRLNRTDRRSLCSQKFAQAFFEANP